MNSASEVRTILGGELCRPSPERRNDSATTKRVKLVTMMSRPGATDSAVRMAAICKHAPGGRSAACGQQRAEIDGLRYRKAGREQEKRRRAPFSSLQHQRLQQQFIDLAARAHKRPVAQILTDVLQADRRLVCRLTEMVRR